MPFSKIRELGFALLYLQLLLLFFLYDLHVCRCLICFVTPLWQARCRRVRKRESRHIEHYMFYCGFLGVSSRVPWQLCARRPTFSPGIGLHQNKIKCNGCCFFCHGWALTGEKFRGRKRRQTVWHKPLYRQKKMRHRHRHPSRQTKRKRERTRWTEKKKQTDT